MEPTDRFVVQGFEHVGGALVPTNRHSAVSVVDALRQAEALAAKLPGSAALRIADEAGAERVTVLGAFGDVPDTVAEGLAGG